jgi:hypothetical protein
VTARQFPFYPIRLPPFDTALFARNLERAYLLMRDRAVAGLEPATIAAG